MNWDNSMNKNAVINAAHTTVLVKQCPCAETVEWTALMASFPQTGIRQSFLIIIGLPSESRRGVIPAPYPDFHAR